uniref:NADH dehydrogenase subunit 6 n=1 Tax=Metasalis populi TaxID=1589681 RepID=A0A343WNP6_9HEMI|nr:NADH dehydrogenase subunit 6 [Metasalis populi]AWD31622.1 NADH dehydrogenase subunit 6 [Metasalis populi]
MLEMLIMLMIIMSILFSSLMTPLSMVVTLILQTMLISIISSIMISSFWYSYMMILIMISGLLILFMYMASIASNEKFNIPTMLILYLMMLGFYLNFTKKEMIFEKKISFYINQEMIMNKLFNYKFMMPTILMITLLFLMMIIVSFLVNSNEGPMRKSN